MTAPCTAPRLAYTEILSETYAAPRNRQQRGFFSPAMGKIRLSSTMGDEEPRITNTGPGVISAESESPALNLAVSLKLMEAHHGHQ